MAIQTQGFGGTVAEVETNTRAIRTILRPTDIGAQGAFRKAMRNSGALTSLAAGLTAGATIFTFRWAPATTSLLALIKRVQMSATIGLTAFAAGIGQFEGYVARTFSANDTGGITGTVTTNNAKLRTAFATTANATGQIQIANTGQVTAGTRTLDTDPFFTHTFGISTVTCTQVLLPTTMYEQTPTLWPLILATQEGFVINGTMPATGTWNFTVSVDWEEVSSFGSATLT